MNRFTIENKNKFCRYFLEPLLKLNPKCVLKIEPDKIHAKSSYPDGSLFLEASSSIDTDILDQKELAFIDLSRFIKTLDFVQKDVVSFKLDQNYLSYKDATNHFTMQMYDTKVEEIREKVETQVMSQIEHSLENILKKAFDLMAYLINSIR